MSTRLEIAVTSDAAAAVAVAQGADRVELCVALELGGVTPSQGLVEATLDTGAETHVLVRSRPGDFVYDAEEIALMAREAAAIARAGAAGVVIGALTPAGGLDLAAIGAMADAARTVRPDIVITIHRAVDASTDPMRAASALAASGLAPTRILSSGGREAAGDGAATLAGMVAAAGPIQVMAGGGVTIASIPTLLSAGVAAVHLSAKRRIGDHLALDAGLVASARREIDAHSPRA
ncbi:MAG TPA: copper homeostasis protein CutC [Gryllotalpicola sp.]